MFSTALVIGAGGACLIGPTGGGSPTALKMGGPARSCGSRGARGGAGARPRPGPAGCRRTWTIWGLSTAQPWPGVPTPRQLGGPSAPASLDAASITVSRLKRSIRQLSTSSLRTRECSDWRAQAALPTARRVGRPARSGLPKPLSTQPPPTARASMSSPASAELFLCVDGGGTSVKVVICGAAGEVLSRGTAGPCNV